MLEKDYDVEEELSTFVLSCLPFRIIFVSPVPYLIKRKNFVFTLVTITPRVLRIGIFSGLP